MNRLRIDGVGNKFWYLNGLLHREDGPAVVSVDNVKKWFKHDVLHREDGPAIEWGDCNKAWYINGLEHTEEEFNQWLIKKALNEKLHNTLAPKAIGKRGKI